MTSLLLIEDDPIMGESLVQRFELEGFDVTWCRRLEEATHRLGKPWSAIISDVRLSDGIATTWFGELPDSVRAAPWFFLTGYGSVNDAVHAIRRGAREYLTKPFDIEKLVSIVRESLTLDIPERSDAVLGVSQAMCQVESLVKKVARQRVSVLLNGGSGVGKEVAAQLIHRLDPRCAKGAFVAVNCAAVPDSMLEAEFFGYEKGAFSGAQRTHRGFLERADGGTLFLDEVGELPASMQAKLLRGLQERCFFRLGAERTVSSDFRIIAATNRNLYTDMAAGKFREDLFYRLAVIRITIPPLRERPEDIRWLTNRFLQELAAQHGRPLAVSEALLLQLMSRPWKGNVRELRSWLEEAVIFSDNGILDASNGFVPPHDDSANGDERFAPLQEVVSEVERRHIGRALAKAEGSVARTAELLGISRKTLWEKMKRQGMQNSPRQS